MRPELYAILWYCVGSYIVHLRITREKKNCGTLHLTLAQPLKMRSIYQVFQLLPCVVSCLLPEVFYLD
jgi:hypothetical protein